MSIAKNLSSLMKINGNLTVTELAQQTKVPQPTLHHILSGLTKNPRRKALEAIAGYFSLTVTQLLGDAPLPDIVPKHVQENLNINTIPIISWEAAHHWPSLKSDSHCDKLIISGQGMNKDCFALMVETMDFEPLFPKGSILIFDPKRVPVNHNYVLVYLKNDHQLRFARLFIDGATQYIKLEEHNGDARLKNIRDEKIVAVMVEARLQFYT